MPKTVTAIASLSLASLCFAGSASALKFDPPNSTFIATGSLTVTAAAVSLPCTAVLQGTTNGDTALITAAAFGGLSCMALAPSGLPWAVTIRNQHNIVIHGVSVSALVLGLCGPGNVPAIDSRKGKLTIAGAGLPGVVPCSVSGTFRTTPHLAVDGR